MISEMMKTRNTRISASTSLILLLLACGGTTIQTDNSYVTEMEPTKEALRENPQRLNDPPTLGKRFKITSILCADEQGPDCTKLRLGDNFLTTAAPERGYLYSCVGKNPNAPGSIGNKITWIDSVNETWDFLEKLWLPDGIFAPERGTYTEILSDAGRQIRINNLPVDGNIGDWPMTNYPSLSEIDGNPGTPIARVIEFSYPAYPSINPSPSCLPLGAIGVTKNGVVIFNPADARGNDAVAHEIIDKFGGHPARNNYHYHFIPERLDNEQLGNGHSGVVGYINDGFPIYGYKGVGGVEMSNRDLDLCHGHEHGTLGYHYHATLEYPYTVGCYRGSSVSDTTDHTSSARR